MDKSTLCLARNRPEQVLDMERYGHVLVKAFTDRVDGPGLEAVVVNYKELHDQVIDTLNIVYQASYLYSHSRAHHRYWDKARVPKGVNTRSSSFLEDVC